MRACPAILLASLATAQSTWIVDDSGGPGVHFTSLPAAVAAAASGDTLLVAQGNYAPFQVSGKALTILGDGASTTLIDGPPTPTLTSDYVAIINPPVGTVFGLSGVSVRSDLVGTSFSSGAAFIAVIAAGSSLAGSVVLRDIQCEPIVTAGPRGGIGLKIAGVAVHASRCSFKGGERVVTTGYPSRTEGLPGGQVDAGSALVADSCLFHGGEANTWGFWSVALGGPGLRVTAGNAWVMRSTLVGGRTFYFGTYYSSGGHGLHIPLNGSAVMNLYGDASHACLGGSGDGSFGGAAGAGIALWGGQVSVYGPVTTGTVIGGVSYSPSVYVQPPGQLMLGLPIRPQLSLASAVSPSTPLFAYQPVSLRIEHGPPGQLFALLLDTSPGLILFPGLSAEPLLVANANVVVAGLLDAAGGFAVTFVPAQHTPQLVGPPLHLQAFAFDPIAGAWLGSNSEVQHIRL